MRNCLQLAKKTSLTKGKLKGFEEELTTFLPTHHVTVSAKM